MLRFGVATTQHPTWVTSKKCMCAAKKLSPSQMPRPSCTCKMKPRGASKGSEHYILHYIKIFYLVCNFYSVCNYITLNFLLKRGARA